MNLLADIQNRFHGELGTYINRCAFSKPGFLLTAASSRAACMINAAGIINSFNSFSNLASSATCPTTPVTLDVPVYSGDNTFVADMMGRLASLEDCLYGAYIHGSLGSGEENAYSDFDALVILKDSLFDSPRKLSFAASRLYLLQRIMQNYDPLQHHGWFVLTETDLRCHCDAYFPTELFNHSKSLLNTSGTHLDVSVRNSEREARDVFNAVVAGVINKTAGNPVPDNMYRLKSLLSEFMLLPALYLQAVNGVGVFKKYSFELAEKDFGIDEWRIMDEVSSIRSDWVRDRRRMLSSLLSLNLATRLLLASRSSSPIPENLQARLTPDFYRRIHTLAVSMRDKII